MANLEIGPDESSWAYQAAEADIGRAWPVWRLAMLECDGLKGADPEALRAIMLVAWLHGAEVVAMMMEGDKH